MPFESHQRIRFHQSDPAGVLFYGRVFELAQAAYEDLCRAAGVDIEGFMRQDGHTTPVAHAEADYRAPIAVGEAIVVRVFVERLGTSALHLRHEIVGADGSPRATVRVVHVHVDVRTWRACPIPDDTRARLLGVAGPQAASGE